MDRYTLRRNTASILKIGFFFILVLFLLETSRGVGFFERKNPLTEELGFSEKQFQTFYSNVTMQNTSSIWVPSEAVRKSLGENKITS